MDTDTADDGPIDVVILSFAGNRFNGAIAPALRDLVVRGQGVLTDEEFAAAKAKLLGL